MQQPQAWLTGQVADALVKLDGANGCLTDFNIYSPRLDGGKDDFVLAGSVLTVKVSLARSFETADG